MTEVLFYHLERSGLDAVLPGLLEKTLARGWKAVVRVGAPDRTEAIDSLLWTYRDDSFLPHGASGDGAVQPIWITAGSDRPNAAEVIFLVEGAKEAVEALSAYQRCVAIFDGADADAVANAREFWKLTKAGGHDVAYWRQTPSGGWEKQA